MPRGFTIQHYTAMDTVNSSVAPLFWACWRFSQVVNNLPQKVHWSAFHAASKQQNLCELSTVIYIMVVVTRQRQRLWRSAAVSWFTFWLIESVCGLQLLCIMGFGISTKVEYDNLYQIMLVNQKHYFLKLYSILFYLDCIYIFVFVLLKDKAGVILINKNHM